MAGLKTQWQFLLLKSVTPDSDVSFLILSSLGSYLLLALEIKFSEGSMSRWRAFLVSLLGLVHESKGISQWKLKRWIIKLILYSITRESLTGSRNDA